MLMITTSQCTKQGSNIVSTAIPDSVYKPQYFRKEEQKFKEDAKAGNHLLLNESVVELPPSYTPAQFENSLGKLQCVTVKAPRQIIDVGVMRHNNESPNMSSEASSMHLHMLQLNLWLN